MRWSRVIMLMAAASVLNGCAGARARQDLARLQSQVGLIDERVAQLERSAMAGGTSAGSLSETPPEGAATVSVSVAPEGAAAAHKAYAISLLKPSTREIQQALKNAGFYQGAVDGKRGPKTREAVKEFQRVHGLTDDGVVGKQTWAKLRAYADLSANSGDVNAAEALK